MKALGLTKFRSQLGNIIKRIHRNKGYVILERDGVPMAAVMDIDEFEDYLELRDAAAQNAIAESGKDIRAGKTADAHDFLDKLKRRTRDI